MGDVFTPKSLAERWQCSDKHIYNLYKQKKIVGFKLGGKLLRIKKEDVERFEQCQTGESQSYVASSPSHSSKTESVKDTASTLLTDVKLRRLRQPSTQN